MDFIGAALAILQATKKEDIRVDRKHIVIKPRVLSDDNMLRGVAGLRAVLALVPPAAIAAPILSLGAMGFKIWKRLALDKEYDQLQFPPVDPNMLRLSIELDSELKRHYGHLILAHNWNDETISEAEQIYNDFQFITDAEMLLAKYPEVDEEYIQTRAAVNFHNLQAALSTIEQGIVRVSHKPEIEHNIREAFEAVKKIFPAMNDWSLFNSEGFEEILDIIDTIF